MMLKNDKKNFVTEHILELRHSAVGKFLDKRGAVGDYIKNKQLFPHWNIQENSVAFFDQAQHIEQDGAVVSYNSIAFLTYNRLGNRNYFKKKATDFWDILIKNKLYNIPNINRFGARIKCFIPSELQFSQIKEAVYSTFFNDKAKEITEEKEIDLQIIFDLKKNDHKIRLILGPLNENEANRHFKFKVDEFKSTGLYVDIDYHKEGIITHGEISKLLNEASQFTWAKLDQISTIINI